MMHREVIPRVVAKLLIPFLLLYALYVQFHGELGPGGGFQAGVIVAAAVILYALIFGLADVKRIVPLRLVEILVPLGVVLYAGVGFAGLAAGATSSTTSSSIPIRFTARSAASSGSRSASWSRCRAR